MTTVDTSNAPAERDAHSAQGFRDGYAVGRSGIDPDGNPAAGYDDELTQYPAYRDGLREGRAQRIDDYAAARGGHDDGLG